MQRKAEAGSRGRISQFLIYVSISEINLCFQFLKARGASRLIWHWTENGVLIYAALPTVSPRPGVFVGALRSEYRRNNNRMTPFSERHKPRVSRSLGALSAQIPTLSGVGRGRRVPVRQRADHGRLPCPRHVPRAMVHPVRTTTSQKGSSTLVSLSVRLKDLLGPVTRVKKKKTTLPSSCSTSNGAPGMPPSFFLCFTLVTGT